MKNLCATEPIRTIQAPF